MIRLFKRYACENAQVLYIRNLFSCVHAHVFLQIACTFKSIVGLLYSVTYDMSLKTVCLLESNMHIQSICTLFLFG